MMAAARIPADTDPALEQEIADLWADGFDSVDIMVALVHAGHPLSEADVCRVLAKQQSRRLAAKARGPADA